jgi:hypothetical protein
MLNDCQAKPEQTALVAQQAYHYACEQFQLGHIHHQTDRALRQLLSLPLTDQTVLTEV